MYQFWLRFLWSLFPKCPTENIPALVQIMAWGWSGDRPLSEPMMVNLLMHICITLPQWVNTLRPIQNVCHFADDILNCIMFNEKALISIKISLTIVPWGPVDNMTALFQIMVWHWTGNKPLFETTMTYFTDAYMRHSASVSWCFIWVYHMSISKVENIRNMTSYRKWNTPLYSESYPGTGYQNIKWKHHLAGIWKFIMTMKTWQWR